jgi:L-fuconolactonase
VPDLPFIDTHVHLWDPRRFRMAWLDGNDLLDRPYGLAEYWAHTASLPVEALVFVQAEVEPASALLEARWVLEQARDEPRIQGIVPWAPIEHGQRGRAFLEALVELGPLVKGVRRLIQSDPDPSFCLQPGFVEGVRLLPAYGLTFDLCLYHYQLASVVELVRRCPETRFVLDHIAKPDIKRRLFDPWRQQIGELAALPNVVCCKVSGLVTEADHERWTPEELAPYVAHVLDVFGDERVMFGSDWPVVLLASSYPRWVETLDALTASLTPEARRKLWASNARRAYQLVPAAAT